MTPDGSSAVRVPGNKSVIDVLQALGDYQTFLLALQVRTHQPQLQLAELCSCRGDTGAGFSCAATAYQRSHSDSPDDSLCSTPLITCRINVQHLECHRYLQNS